MSSSEIANESWAASLTVSGVWAQPVRAITAVARSAIFFFMSCLSFVGKGLRSPCAGITQIRFDGRRLTVFLSDRYYRTPVVYLIIGILLASSELPRRLL